MLNQVIILQNDADRVSVGSLNDSNVWDLDDEDSSGGNSSSSDEEDFAQSMEEALEISRLQHTRECIDDALEVLTCSDPDKLFDQKLDIPDLYNSLVFKSDRPPARPRRSFDIGKKALYRDSTNHRHDRFQLSQSEHTSSSLSPPSFPTRPVHLSASEEDPSKLEGPLSNGETLKPKRWLDSPHKGVRDGGIRRASLCSELIRPASLCSEIDQLTLSERGQVTLRVSEARVLRGTRELSTSQHLRRSCPGPRMQPS